MTLPFPAVGAALGNPREGDVRLAVPARHQSGGAREEPREEHVKMERRGPETEPWAPSTGGEPGRVNPAEPGCRARPGELQAALRL